MLRLLLLASFALQLALASSPLARAATPATLTAGVAAADITPDPRMMNWVLPKPYGAVNDPLFARALVLSDGPTRIVLITWDLLDAREFAVARIRGAVSAATKIPPAHTIINASHNHSGPKSEMGPELNSAREARTSRPAQNDPLYRSWADRLTQTCVDLVTRADAARQPATLSIGRAYIGEWMFNRRPIKPDNSVRSMSGPADPHVLGQGLRFGVFDPTMTVLTLRAADGTGIATLFHAPMHAVAIYSAYPGLSADWPGAVAKRLKDAGVGEPMFLQGCAGDVVPSRRGFEAVKAMSESIAKRVGAARKVAEPLAAGKLRTQRAIVGAPTTPAAAKDQQRASLDAEVQVVTMGDLAIVTLPGEPLGELATSIQSRSPFPHTIVLGYTNGRGVGYVGLPGGKAKGGYEMSDVGHGADEAGSLLVAAAVRLLNDQATAAKR